jgi:hypothetical protein
MVLIYAFSQYIILRFVKQKSESIKSPVLNTARKFVSAAQFSLIALFLILILQMTFIMSYDILLLKAIVWISCITSVILLGLLAQKFFSWFKFRRNSVVLSYAIAMSILSLNAAFIILDVTGSSERSPEEYVRPLRIVSNTAFFGILETFHSGYLITSALSFILTWIATVLMLRHYSRKLGMIKYWIIVGIPLVYFLGQFQTSFLDLLTPFRTSDPVTFGIVYTLFFTATKPVGGILFGIAFWSVARNITRHVLRDYMMISAYGMMLLFASNQTTGLILVHYPPFGLVTISFLGVASYLILIGIYSSAISLTQDMNLRQSLRKTVEKESELLQKIGTSEMELEIQKRVMKITKDLSNETRDMTEKTGIEASLEEDEVKEYIKVALEEIKASKNPKSA